MKTLHSVITGLIAFIGLLCASAIAQTFPTKGIRIIAPFPPASVADVLARPIAQKMNEAWGQPVIVDNRTGAAGNVGTEVVAKAPPDGYTLLLGTIGTNAINALIYARLPFNAQKDFVPITQVATSYLLLVMHPSVPDIPTINETLSGFELAPWFGLFAPAGTPREVVVRLNTETVRILALQEIKSHYTNLGMTAVSSTPEQFGAHVAEEIARWAKIVKATGARAD